MTDLKATLKYTCSVKLRAPVASSASAEEAESARKTAQQFFDVLTNQDVYHRFIQRVLTKN
jgi:hypothetical protein